MLQLICIAVFVALGYLLGRLFSEYENEKEKADEHEMSALAGDVMDRLMDQYEKNWRFRRALVQIHMECGLDQRVARERVKDIERGGRLKLKAGAVVS